MSEVITSPPGYSPDLFGLDLLSDNTVSAYSLPNGDLVINAQGAGGTSFSTPNTADTSAITFFGGTGDDTAVTGAGADLLETGAGDDRIFSNLGDDIVRAGFGNDSVDGGQGNDQLFGGVGSDTIYGGVGNDTVDGGEGADILFATAGADTLTGGPGSDVFRFESGSNYELDTITDFTPGADTIQLDPSLLPGSGLTGTLDATQFATVTGTIGDAAVSKIVYNSATGQVFYKPAGAGTAPVELLKMQAGLAVTPDSFTVGAVGYPF